MPHLLTPLRRTGLLLSACLLLNGPVRADPPFGPDADILRLLVLCAFSYGGMLLTGLFGLGYYRPAIRRKFHIALGATAVLCLLTLLAWAVQFEPEANPHLHFWTFLWQPQASGSSGGRKELALSLLGFPALAAAYALVYATRKRRA